MRRIAGRHLVAVSPGTAVSLGVAVLALRIAEFPLAGLAHQSVSQSNGSLPLWYSAPFGVLGFVLAWRNRRQQLKWPMGG